MSEIPKHIGKYQIQRVLGQGGMGIVYQGIDPAIERKVALKVIHTHLGDSEQSGELLARFHSEAKAVGRLSHPNIVAVYEYGDDNGAPFIALEFIEGSELGALMRSGKRFTEERVIFLIQQVLSALAYCHAQGVVHRDMKPANILLNEAGDVKLTDFGIAHLDTSDLTQTGAVLGTPTYMSPEQLQGQPIDARADLFAVGVILYELLTGERPFPGRTMAMVMHNVLKGNFIDPTTLNVHLAPSFGELLRKAVAIRPADRFQSAEQFSAELERVSLASQGGGLGLGEDIATEINVGSPTVASAAAESAASGNIAEEDSERADRTDILDTNGQLPAGMQPQRKNGPGRLVIGSALAIAVAGIAGWFVFSPDSGSITPGAPIAPVMSSQSQSAPVASVDEEPVDSASKVPPAVANTAKKSAIEAATATAPVANSVEIVPEGNSAPAAKTIATETRPKPRVATPKSTSPAVDPITITSEPNSQGIYTLVRVKATPSGALISINNQPFGLTPIEFELTPGQYRLTISKQGFDTAATRLDIRKSTRLTVSVALKAAGRTSSKTN